MDNDKYFDLLKGSGEIKSVNQHDGFGDLLSECRISGKEKVAESNVDEEYSTADVESDIEKGVSGVKIITNIRGTGKSFAQAKQIYVDAKARRERDLSHRDESKVYEDKIVKKYAKLIPDYDYDTDDKELDRIYTIVDNLYPEASDEEKDYLQNIMDEIELISNQHERDEELEALEDTDESKKVNELDEPDLERPEAARRRKPKPKKRRPVRPKPDVDEIPKEEPEPEAELEEKPPKEEEPEVPEIGEPDRDEVPPPPEELSEPEQPIEMRKEYLGRSKETHYYFITTEGEGGVVADFVIADQEGVKKYSAKDKDIDVSEENIAEFLIQAYRDMDIAQIERSIFMKYLYPEIIKRGPEEEMVEEPELEDEFGKEKKPLEPGGDEEEERPRESKKGKPPKKYSEEEQWKRRKEDHAAITGKKDKKEVKESYLIEMQVTDGIGNEFDVNLAPDDTEDAVININGREFRFSGEFASMWRDETGAISEEGLEELALDALAMMEEDEYQELVSGEVNNVVTGDEEEIDTSSKSIPGETDWPLKDRPEPESEVTGGIDEPTDDVDMSKGDIHRKLKYPSEKEEGEEEFSEKLEELSTELFNKRLTELTPEESAEVHQAYREWQEVGEGKNQPGIRDGTGPAKDSVQRKTKGDVGKRKQAGMKCSKENKENDNIEGDSEMNEKKTPKALHKEASELEARAKKLHTEAEDLKLKQDKAKKDEGIDPKKEDSEDTKIKKLAEDGEVKEDKIDETDVAKGAKALVQLLKDAVKEGDYAKAAEYATKAAEIEAMVPAEAEAKVDEKPAKDDKAPEKKDDKKDDEAPEKKDDKKDDEAPEKKDDLPAGVEKEKGADEKKKPPACDKCGKAHWPFDKCSETEDVDEAKDKKDKEAKAKKEKADKEAKAKKDKEEKAKKDKKAKAKKESKIPVEDNEDISERKGLNLLNELLGIK